MEMGTLYNEHPVAVCFSGPCTEIDKMYLLLVQIFKFCGCYDAAVQVQYDFVFRTHNCSIKHRYRITLTVNIYSTLNRNPSISNRDIICKQKLEYSAIMQTIFV